MLVEVEDGLADAGRVGEAEVFDRLDGMRHVQGDLAAAVEIQD